MRSLWLPLNSCRRILLPKAEAQMTGFRSVLAKWTLRRNTRGLRTSSSITSEENPERYCVGGYHPVQLDEVFNNKYKIISKLGFGLYSTVWLAEDVTLQAPKYVALKILTADAYGSSDGTYELNILKHIKHVDSTHPGYQHVVHLLDNFLHDGPHGKHLCLTLSLMGPSALDLRRSIPERQLPLRTARKMTTQVLQALDWLHGSCHIIHTDIKPDNILIDLPDVNDAVEKHLEELQQQGSDPETSRLVSRPIPQRSARESHEMNFRLTDFGVSSWHDDHLTEWIQPASLRAPEVFLGAPWDYSADIWGLACVVYQQVQGRVLFRGRPSQRGTWTAEEDQLVQMMELFGPIPNSLLARGKSTSRYFDENGDLLHIKQMHPYSLRELLKQTKNDSMSDEDYNEFESFLLAMLKFEPGERKTARELLEMSWLQGDK